MQPDEQARLLDALATSAGELITGPAAEDTLEDKLSRLTRAAVSNVPGADFAGLTLQHQGQLTSHGPSAVEITDLDQLQAQLGEGPCVDAITSGTVTVIAVPDFAPSSRWRPGLETALVSRDVIGQAKGILMERHGIDADRAFERLAAASQHANLKLVDVARWLVGQSSTTGSPEQAGNR